MKDELKKRGYNAMVDVAGVGYKDMGIEGVDPLIIFDGDDTLNKVSTSQLDVETRRNASDRYDQWYKNANKKR